MFFISFFPFFRSVLFLFLMLVKNFANFYKGKKKLLLYDIFCSRIEIKTFCFELFSGCLQIKITIKKGINLFLIPIFFLSQTLKILVKITWFDFFAG